MSTRRTRANPSPGGFRQLEDEPKPKRGRKPRKSAQELFANPMNADDIDSDDRKASAKPAISATARAIEAAYASASEDSSQPSPNSPARSDSIDSIQSNPPASEAGRPGRLMQDSVTTPFRSMFPKDRSVDPMSPSEQLLQQGLYANDDALQHSVEFDDTPQQFPSGHVSAPEANSQPSYSEHSSSQHAHSPPSTSQHLSQHEDATHESSSDQDIPPHPSRQNIINAFESRLSRPSSLPGFPVSSEKASKWVIEQHEELEGETIIYEESEIDASMNRLSDDGASDNESSDDEASGNESSEEESSEDEASGDKASEDGGSEENTSEDESFECSASEDYVSEDESLEEISEYDASKHEEAEHEALEHEVMGHGAHEHEPTAYEESAHEVSEHQAIDYPATERKATEPEALEHEVPAHEVSEHDLTEFYATGHRAVEHQASEPQASETPAPEPQASEHQPSEHQASEPQASEPQASEPQVSEPQTSETQASETQASGPHASEPQASESTSSGALTLHEHLDQAALAVGPNTSPHSTPGTTHLVEPNMRKRVHEDDNMDREDESISAGSAKSANDSRPTKRCKVFPTKSVDSESSVALSELMKYMPRREQRTAPDWSEESLAKIANCEKVIQDIRKEAYTLDKDCFRYRYLSLRLHKVKMVQDRLKRGVVKRKQIPQVEEIVISDHSDSESPIVEQSLTGRRNPLSRSKPLDGFRDPLSGAANAKIVKGKAKQKKPYDRHRAALKANYGFSGSSDNEAEQMPKRSTEPKVSLSRKTRASSFLLEAMAEQQTGLADPRVEDYERDEQYEKATKERKAVLEPSRPLHSSFKPATAFTFNASLGRPDRVLTKELVANIHCMADWQNYDPKSNILPSPDEMVHILENYKRQKLRKDRAKAPARKVNPPSEGKTKPVSRSEVLKSSLGAMPAISEHHSAVERNVQSNALDTQLSTGKHSPEATAQAVDQSTVGRSAPDPTVWEEGDSSMQDQVTVNEQSPQTPGYQVDLPAAESHRWSNWFQKIVSTPFSLLTGHDQPGDVPGNTNNVSVGGNENVFNVGFRSPSSPTALRGRRLKRGPGAGPRAKISEGNRRKNRLMEFEDVSRKQREQLRAVQIELEESKRKARVELKVSRFENNIPRRIVGRKRRLMIEGYRDNAENFSREGTYGFMDEDPLAYEEDATEIIAREAAKIEAQQEAQVNAPKKPQKPELPEGWDDKEWTETHSWIPTDYEPTWQKQPYHSDMVDWVTGCSFPTNAQLKDFQSKQDARTDPYTGRIFKSERVLHEFQSARFMRKKMPRIYYAAEDSYTLEMPCYFTDRNVFGEPGQGRQGADPIFMHNLSYLPPPTYKRPKSHMNYDGTFPDEPSIDQPPEEDVSIHDVSMLDVSPLPPKALGSPEIVHPILGHRIECIPGTTRPTLQQQGRDIVRMRHFYEELDMAKKMGTPIPPELEKPLKAKLLMEYDSYVKGSWANDRPKYPRLDFSPKQESSRRSETTSPLGSRQGSNGSKEGETQIAQDNTLVAQNTPSAEQQGSQSSDSNSPPAEQQGLQSSNLNPPPAEQQGSQSSDANPPPAQVLKTTIKEKKPIFPHAHTPKQSSKLRTVCNMSPLEIEQKKAAEAEAEAAAAKTSNENKKNEASHVPEAGECNVTPLGNSGENKENEVQNISQAGARGIHTVGNPNENRETAVQETPQARECEMNPAGNCDVNIQTGVLAISQVGNCEMNPGENASDKMETDVQEISQAGGCEMIVEYSGENKENEVQQFQRDGDFDLYPLGPNPIAIANGLSGYSFSQKVFDALLAIPDEEMMKVGMPLDCYIGTGRRNMDATRSFGGENDPLCVMQTEAEIETENWCVKHYDDGMMYDEEVQI